jgi:hypothetical protein
MSKKLIAVASAAALALAALVAMPAQASASWVVSITDDAGTSEASASSVRTPAKNLSLEGNQLDPDLLVEFSVDASSTSAITVKSFGGVKLIASGDEVADEDADVEYKLVKDGKESLPVKSLTSASDAYVFYAYTTSTTAGKVEIKDASGNTQNYYVASEVGDAYNIAVTFPAAVPVKVGGASLLVKVTDVFGNSVSGTDNEDPDTFALSATLVGAEFATEESESVSDFIWKKSAKAWVPSDSAGSEDTMRAGSAGPVVISLSLDVTDLEVGFAAPKKVAFKVLSSASLEAQIASLEAKLANSVSKAKYNNLVKKYNKITRGKKAKLVK